MSFSELRTLFQEHREAVETAGAANKKRLDELRAENAQLLERIEVLESKRNVPGRTAPASGRNVDGVAGLDRPEMWVTRREGKLVRVPVLGHKDRWSALAPNKTGISVGRFLRAKLLGDRAEDWSELQKEIGELEEHERKAMATSPDAAGGFTVPAPLAREFIDLLRSQLVLSQAGARLVPMESKTLQVAQIVADAPVSWHAENAALTAADPTLDSVTLNARTVVGIVRFSLELAQDSLNIQEAITRSLTGAMAAEIDRVGLLGDGSNNSPTGVQNFNGRNSITGIGALSSYDPWIDAMGALLASNVPLERITASVMGADVWTALAKLKTGIAGDRTPLVRPAALNDVRFLPTTLVPTSGGSPQIGAAFLADWGDLLYGVRQDISVRVLQEAFMGSNLQLAVLVYARVDFQPARAESFCTLEGLVT